MYRIALTLLILLICIPPALAQGTETSVDYVILIDESGSMVGLPAGSSNVDILPQVKENVSSFLGQLEPGASVFIGTFSDGLKDFERFDISSRSDIEAVQRYVENVEADGSATHVYRSIESAFSEYVDWRGNQPNGEHRVGTMLIYTDGKDNSGTHTINDVLETFDAKRNRHDWLYYSTLGVDLEDSEVDAFDDHANATLISTPRGTVRPLRIVEPSYPVLDFGNLLGAGRSSREMDFNVRSEGGLPDDASVTATASFPEVAQRGAAAEVSPSSFRLGADRVPLTLELVNEESLPHGVYEGSITFDATDESVLVAPAEIVARFRYRPPRVVSTPNEVSADFGDLSPYSDSAAATSSVLIPLSFNSEARRAGGAYAVRVETAGGSPPLPASALTVNGETGSYHEFEVADGDNLRFDAQVDESVPPGTYEGTVVVESADLEIDENLRAIPWSITVVERPWSLWNWLALALGILLLGGLVTYGALAYSRGSATPWVTAMSGRLNVIKPASASQEVVLSGEASVTLGDGTATLPDAEARITLRAERSGRAISVKAVADEGAPTLQRAGERYPMAFASEELHPGDVLVLGPYHLEYLPY